jgi:hypothetical protein
MKKMLFLLLILFAVTPVFADMTIVQKVTSGPFMGQPGGDDVMTMKIKGSKARIDHSNSKTFQIIDLAQQKIYTADPDKKSVMILPLDMMQQVGSAVMGMGGGTINFKKTGRTEKINGYNCEEYVMSSEGMMKLNGNLWVTKDFDVAEYGPFKEFAESFLKGMKADNPPEGMTIRSNTKMNMMGKEVSATNEVQNVSREPVPDSVFVIPPDYKTEEMPKM